MKFGHGSSPIEVHPGSRSLLWNPVLTASALGWFKVLVDFHMWNDVEFRVLIYFIEFWAWTFAHWISLWILELALGSGADTICIKRIFDSTLHRGNQPWAICINHLPQHPTNQQLNGAHTGGHGKPAPVWQDWGECSLDLIHGFVFHVAWEGFSHGSSPTEFHLGFLSSLWNPMLAAFAPRELTSLVDFHTWVDVILWVLFHFR